ncbi:hypothetical protein JCM30471_14270 [Desulfuromonas carbonis]|uniref:cell division protein ZapA n=1 Tax=Desulfuromonas sp. DDH964 TaxID=1823759 RepID=UPI00078CE828|nr:cell division protein ZapA [Desulfuromonas sp. DDH964]AMV73012.1 cell division protein ZapA [Desulfuromonas sp. DDH964]
MKQSVQVTILGQQYTLRSESDPAEVRQIAEFVDRRVAEVQSAARTADSYTAVVLALLNVAGELFAARRQAPAGGDEGAEERLQKLLARIEAACAAPPPVKPGS